MSSTDDKFARYLDGKSRVSRAYRDLDAPEPPAALSASVLAEARAAVAGKTDGPAGRPGWMVPLSLAATLVVAVSIAFQTLPSRSPEVSVGDLEPGARGAPVDVIEQKRDAPELAAAQTRAPPPRPEMTIEREPLPVAPGRINDREAREAIADASEEIRRNIVRIPPPSLPNAPSTAKSSQPPRTTTERFAAAPPQEKADTEQPARLQTASDDNMEDRQVAAVTGSRVKRTDMNATGPAVVGDAESDIEEVVIAGTDAATQDGATARPRERADSDASFGMSASDEVGISAQPGVSAEKDEAFELAADAPPSAAATSPATANTALASSAPQLDPLSERAARTWLADIRQLHDDGDIEEAEAALLRFRERFPDYPLPDDFPLPDPADTELP